jgi:hypothetical protein
MRGRLIHSAAIPFFASLLLLTGTGCSSPASVGAPCDLGMSTTGGDVTISGPALECAGGLCLQVGNGPALCSAGCGSDDDCAGHVPASAGTCQRGFTCTAATSVGTYACRKLCVCLDLLPAPPLCETAL